MQSFLMFANTTSQNTETVIVIGSNVYLAIHFQQTKLYSYIDQKAMS